MIIGVLVVSFWRRILRRPLHRFQRLLRYRRHLSRHVLAPLPVRIIKAIGFLPIVYFRTPVRQLRRKRRQAWRDVTFEFYRRRLHTNACGDFTMLARDRWFRLRGYAEFEMYSFHIDSLLCHSAACLGIGEQILEDPARIYHMEHSEGSGFTPETQQALWTRMVESKVKRLSDDNFWALALNMRAKKRSPIFNNENWGLIRHDLPETDPTAPDIVQRAARAASSGGA